MTQMIQSNQSIDSIFRGEWGELSGKKSWHAPGPLYEKVCELGNSLTTRIFLKHRPGLHSKNINMIALIFFVLLMDEVFGFVFWKLVSKACSHFPRLPFRILQPNF